MAKVHITIDGQAVAAQAGCTVLEAAQEAGVDIPTLCHHPALTNQGACRVCLVEIERQRTLQPACTFPITEGMVVHTESEKVVAARKFVLELLFSERNHYCMYCQMSGDCELQDLAYRYSIAQWPYPRPSEGKPVDAVVGHAGQHTMPFRPGESESGAGEWAAQSLMGDADTPRSPIEGGPLPEEYFGSRPSRKRTWVLWGAVAALLIALIVTAVSIYRWGGPGELGAVPNVVGLSLPDAEKTLSDAGFKLENGGTRPSADVAEGLVGDQDPDAGIPMRKGQNVIVYISSGGGPVQIPVVVGMDRYTAIDRLEALGLNVLVEEEPTDDTTKVNYIQRQEPASGNIVDPGTTVTIWVAVPNNTVLVPSLLGLSQTAAENVLIQLGLVPKVTEVNSSLPGGTVLTQNPQAGTPVEAGSEVQIEVSNAPEQNMVAVPPVAQVGLSLAQATNLLTQYHLDATAEYYETSDSSQWDKVIQQDPVAGTIVPAGTKVKLTVGKQPTTTTTLAPTTTTTLAPTTTTSTTSTTTTTVP